MRLEDPALLSGAGAFVDDVRVEGVLHVAVLRSLHAHARLLRVDAARARAHRGVVAALSHADLPQPVPPLPNLRPHRDLRARVGCPLAGDRVRYVGEPVAVVVATSRYAAEDALEEIDVDYDPLPAVLDLAQAADGRPTLVHDDLGTNVACRIVQRVGEPERVLAEARRTLTRSFRVSRGAGQSIETRGVLAVPDLETGALTVWASCQRPHQNRRLIASMLGVCEDRVRVIAGYVGGGFGPKGRFYPEDYLVPMLAWTLRRPVKWIEDRREHLLSTTHERAQIHEITVAYADDGAVLALADRFLHDMGAYVSAGIVVPLNTTYTLPGPYRIPHLSIDGTCVYTNRMTTSPVRGAGQPEAAFVMEHVIAAVAEAVRRDPAEVRRRALIPPDAFPYAVGLTDLEGQPVVYDSGNLPECLDRALDAVDYRGVRAEQPALWQRGIHRGVSVACYVECTGVGPQEQATVRVDAEGAVTVVVGCGSQGQSHQTMLAQVCAETLGADAARVGVVEGDTAQASVSMGTYGSRTAVVAATAVALAAQALRARLLTAAARLTSRPAESLRIEGGRLRGSSEHHTYTLGDLAREAARDAGASGAGAEHAADDTVSATASFTPPRPATGSGAHAAVVEVDPASGDTRILRYAVVHDCGRVINAAVVDGQVHGGVAHGIGETLYERIVYDDDGQLLTTTLKDYLLPTAVEVPDIVTHHVETPSPLNPLGTKGAGEGGVVPVSAVLSLAIEDALRPHRIVLADAPLTPETIWRAVGERAASGAEARPSA
jgi:CO/xanthine dehydrogenase Mo-binding subunit